MSAWQIKRSVAIQPCPEPVLSEEVTQGRNPK